VKWEILRQLRCKATKQSQSVFQFRKHLAQFGSVIGGQLNKGHKARLLCKILHVDGRGCLRLECVPYFLVRLSSPRADHFLD